jgi:purine-nucleoside phosphorylase
LTGFELDRAAAAVREGLKLESGGCDAAVVLGSGLDGAVAEFTPLAEMTYAEVPGLGPCKVPGHRGALALCSLAGLRVLFFRGRRHYYETGSMADAAVTARLAAALGAKFLLLLSAMGAVNPELGVGDWVYVEDHVNLMGTNPLLGVRGPDGPPFLDLTSLYRADLCHKAAQRPRLDGGTLRLRPAVLAAFSGPTYETPAEIRMARALGADVVGMSTVPEAVWARHLGLHTAAYGRIANLAAGVGGEPLRHEDVVKAAAGAAPETAEIVRRTLEAWAEDSHG